MVTTDKPVLTVVEMALAAGIDARWLRAKARAGVIRCLDDGRGNLLFNRAATLERLAELAAERSTTQSNNQHDA